MILIVEFLAFLIPLFYAKIPIGEMIDAIPIIILTLKIKGPWRMLFIQASIFFISQYIC